MAYTGGQFPTDTDAWLSSDLRHTLRVVLDFDGTSLSVEAITATVRMDETWSPRVTADIVIPYTDAAWVSAVTNPTSGARRPVALFPGYVHPDGTAREAAWPWWVWVRSRERDYAEGTITLTLASTEAVVQDYQHTSATPVTIAGTSRVDSAISQMLLMAIPLNDLFSSSAATLGASVVISRDNSDVWAAIVDAADRAWCQIVPVFSAPVTGGMDWELVRPTGTPDPVNYTALATGPAGTVSGWKASDTRDGEEFAMGGGGFANVVMVKYTGPTPGYQVATNAASVAATGVRARVYQRASSVPSTNQVPQAILERSLMRGHRDDVTAIAAYWLRPGMTVRLPDDRGAVVTAVAFDFTTGLMTLSTRSA